MPGSMQVFFGMVQIAGAIGMLFAWLKLREQNKTAATVARVAKEVHAAQTEVALWQEINALRKELGKIREELALVRREKHDWRGRANKWKLWYTVARGQTMTLHALLDACREQNNILREKLHMPNMPDPDDNKLLGDPLPSPEQIADPIEDLPDPTNPAYAEDDRQP